MSPKNYNFSLIATIVLLVSAYLFTSGYLLTVLADVDLRTVDWSSSNIQALFAAHPLLSIALAVPAVYCLAVLLSLIVHRRKINVLAIAQDNAIRLSADKLTKEEADMAAVVAIVSDEPKEQNSVNKQLDFPPSNNALVDRLKKDLVIAEEQLKIANKARKHLISNMSHELRTPMNGILGMTELLVGSGLNSNQTKFADSVRRSSESLLGVINDLLDYTRMESGGMYLEKASFNLRDLVEDVCDLKASEAQIKGLELLCHIDRSMNDQVIGDANRIRQLLGNLISNGIKFTKKGEIVVKVKQLAIDDAKSTFQIDVVDSGIGISPEGQARIFDSFSQADSSKQREYEGSGLGLFITHKLVELMDGEITLRSRMQEGSHFTVKLNLKQASSENDSLNMADTLRGVRVLVVDDNETNRTILFHQLRTWGVDAETVESGAVALKTLIEAQENDCPFEVAILDLHMPEMDGLELARHIDSNPKLANIARMMLTSAALDMSEDELAKIGISQYISKPARQSQLYTALLALIPRSPHQNENSGFNRHLLSFHSLGFNVLLAEDNIINQEVALNMLNNFGCTVEVTNNGQAALDACASRQFDLIMMDCVMPLISGIEATEIIRASAGLNANTPILALTANVSAEDEKRCLDSGMNDYICKPVTQNELYRRLDKWSQQVSENRRIQKPKKDQINRPKLAATVSTADKSVATKIVLAANTTNPTATSGVTPVVTPAVDVINTETIENIRKLQRPGKPDLVAKVLSVYVDRSPELVEAITTGVEAQDFKSVKEAAHSMKSSSAYVGAEKLADCFKKIETTADAQNIDGLKSLVKNLPDEYAQVSAQLQMYLDKAA